MIRISVVLAFCTALVQLAAQPCSSRRYQDTIFHELQITTGIHFATATPYGLLAQPQDLYLDFYEPAGDTLARRPLIIFQFGGGFAMGWRTEPDIPQFCSYFAQCGYAVATIDYRIGLNPLDTGSTLRAYYRGVQDERSAIRFLCQNAQQFRVDTSNIILTGTSAGCFCALANAFTTNADRPLSTFGTALEPDDLGCMDCSGNNDFGQRIPAIKAIVNQWGAMLDTSLIQTGENTAVISFHGDQDLLVPYVYGFPFQLPVFPKVYGSLPIHQRLTNIGVRNELHPLVGYGHEPELLAPNLNDTIYNYSRIFLEKLLRPNTGPINGPAAVCKSQTATYTVSARAGSRYCWSLSGNGAVVQNRGNSIVVLWGDTGTVSVSVKELNAIDAEGDSVWFSTQVVPDVRANFGYQINELHVALANWSAHASNYYWAFGDGSFSQDENPLKDYTTGGNYLVTLVADNAVCTDTFSTLLAVDSCPKASFTYTVSGTNVFLYAQNTNTADYHWFFGDGDSASTHSPNVVHHYQAEDNYEVSLVVKNTLACSDTDRMTISWTTSGICGVNDARFAIEQYGNREVVVRNRKQERFSVVLYQTDGKQVLTQTAERLLHLPLTELPQGLYLLRIDGTEQSVFRKVPVY